MTADAWSIVDKDVCCTTCGRDACEDHTPATASRLAFVSAAATIDAPRPTEIVEGFAWAGCLTVLVAESGVGKTFVMLDLAAAISAGTSWHGRDVQQGSVAYLSYEGDALGTRLQGIRDVAGRRLDHVYVLRPSDPLSPRVSRDGEEPSVGELDVVAAIQALIADLESAGLPPLRLVTIDTVRASFTGTEDSSEHVAAYLRAVRRIMAHAPSAAAVLVHHAGWQDGEHQRKRERGSSAWRGNCDATLYVEAGQPDGHSETEITIRALKVRDAEHPAPLRLVRRRVELRETDRRGQPVTTCVIESDRRTLEDRAAEVTAAADRDKQETDLRLLRAIVERPELATSQDRLRVLIGGRKAAIGESLSRLVRSQLVEPGTRNQPYVVTAAGRAALTRESQS